MQNELVEYETAVAAKDKGFNWYNVPAYFHINSGYNLGFALCLSNVNEQSDGCLLCPTQSLLQRWLREAYNVNVQVYLYTSTSNTHLIYRCEIVKHNKKEVSKIYGVYEGDKSLDKLSPPIDFSTYEQALERGLFEALKLIKHV